MGTGYHGGFGNTSGSNSGKDFYSFPKTIDPGKQGKHIVGHNNYQSGKSYLTISMNEAQDLINQYSGSGTKINDHKERVDFGRVIDKYVDKDTGEEFDTTVGIIHYSDSGTHIVPARPKED